MIQVLIIDDEEMMRSLLRDMLEELGCDVREAGNGLDGIALLEDKEADLILTDILMPGQDGVETIAALRKQHPDTTIVAMSGGGARRNMTFLDLAMQFGADASLAKPISLPDLAKIVEREIVRKSTHSGGDDVAEPFVFRPIWDLARHALMAFRPEPGRQTADASALIEIGALSPLLGIIADMTANKRDTLGLLSIDAAHLQNKEKLLLLVEGLKILPEALKQHLVIELRVDEKKVPASAAESLISFLRGYCRSIVCLARPKKDTFDRLKRAGAFATGLTLGSASVEQEAKIMDRLPAYVDLANKAGLQVIIHGMNSRSLTTAAVCAGVDFMSGDAIARPLTRPDAAIRFEPMNLFAKPA